MKRIDIIAQNGNTGAHYDIEKKKWGDYLKHVNDVVEGKENGGSTPSQYGLPEGAEDLQDLIEYRHMDFATANIFKACYRLGYKNERIYDLNKIKWFVERLINIEEGNDRDRNT
ncbi:MAG: hypothetical protein DRQ89_13655 [Epsilonproteobacteria bacterium]|nr:MAG: hypothetical protein DRQ89_13655 [Campylobacterota bacterium]